MKWRIEYREKRREKKESKLKKVLHFEVVYIIFCYVILKIMKKSILLLLTRSDIHFRNYRFHFLLFVIIVANRLLLDFRFSSIVHNFTSLDFSHTYYLIPVPVPVFHLFFVYSLLYLYI